MSFGVFEASIASDQEVGLAKQASVDKMAAVIYDVREKLGPVLFASRTLGEFREKIALMKRDQSLYRVIENAGLFPNAGTVRRIVGKGSALEREFKERLAGEWGEGPAGEDLGEMYNSTMNQGGPDNIGQMAMPGVTGGPGSSGSGMGAVTESIPQNNQSGGTFQPGTVASHRWATDHGLQEVPDDDPADFAQHVAEPATEERLLPHYGGPETDVISAPGQEEGSLGNPGVGQELGYMEQGMPGAAEAPGQYRAYRQGADKDPHRPIQSLEETFQPSDKLLKPKDDWDGYRNRMDQGGPAKVKKHNFAAMEFGLYRDWCASQNLSPARLSSLDAYGGNLSDQQYFRIATAIQAAEDTGVDWANEYHPSTPKGQSKTKLKNVTAGHGKHHPDGGGSGGEQMALSDMPFPGFSSNPNPEFNSPEFAQNLQALMALSPEDQQRYIHQNAPHHHERGVAPGITPPDGTPPEQRMQYIREHGGYPEDVQAERGRQGNRHQAAPDYLQKADDALTQLLNQKAEEFQQTIAPLQQALVTVQQAEQLQQAQNPMSVLPPAGTVNVMPGGDQGPAGMPAPGATDLGPAAAALAGGPPGGDPGGGDPSGGAPGGGMADGSSGPPPAAAGGGLPPDAAEQMLRGGRRKRGGQGKGEARSAGHRQAQSVTQLWSKWVSDPTSTQRGGDADYEAFAQQFGVGQQALNKLKAQHNGTTIANRRGAGWKNLKDKVLGGPEGDLDTDIDADLHREAAEHEKPLWMGPQGPGPGAHEPTTHRKPQTHLVPMDDEEYQSYVGGQGERYSGGEHEKWAEPLVAEQSSIHMGGEHDYREGDDEQIFSPARGHGWEHASGPSGPPYVRDEQPMDEHGRRRAPSHEAAGTIGNPFALPGDEYPGDGSGWDHWKKDPVYEETDDPYNPVKKVRGRPPRAITEHDDYSRFDPATHQPIPERGPDIQEALQRGSRKQAWSGWGPAVFPRTREVTGWKWDEYLNGYTANRSQRFACECGDDFEAPSGFHRCSSCGKPWNSYVIGTGGNAREAAAEKFLVREVPQRRDVIVASQHDYQHDFDRRGEQIAEEQRHRPPMTWHDLHDQFAAEGLPDMQGMDTQMQREGVGTKGNPYYNPAAPQVDPKKMWNNFNELSVSGVDPRRKKPPGTPAPAPPPAAPGGSRGMGWEARGMDDDQLGGAVIRHTAPASDHPSDAQKYMGPQHWASFELVDEKTGRRYEMIDPYFDEDAQGEIEDDWPSDHHPGTDDIKSTPSDWHHRDQNQRWTA